ncbi:MAG TPA: carbohydrate binding family 9 domain-containing protein [Vicinamibacterales bacterium]|nr:carbohydrate binding family 9 domain-containing protein [Vicinamibacterales bacterium]
MLAAALLVCTGTLTDVAWAQAPRPELRRFNLPGTPDPPAPVLPEVISRGDNGRVVVRATRLDHPLVIDGQLDEPFYQDVRSLGGFIQTVPNEGEPSTERTEAWVAYDDTNFYLACRCWDSAPPEEWTANEYRRDTSQLRQNDVFGALLDTFHGRRNGFHFYANPLGARADQVIANEGNPNSDWNPVWFVRTGRFEGGWTVEMAIPFRSIRCVSGPDQTWGLQIRRSIQHVYPAYELLGRAPAQRRLAAQQRRRALHEQVHVASRRRLEPGLRHRRGVLVLSERHGQRLLRAQRIAQSPGRRRQLPGARRVRRRSLRRAPRSSRCRDELLSGSRLRAAARLRPYLRRRALSPRMRRSRVVRRYLFEGAAEYLVNRDHRLESSSNNARFLTEFQSSDQFTLDVTADQELLVRPFAVARGVSIQPGNYRFASANASYAFGQQRRASGTVAVRAGEFYNGHLTALSLTGARVALLKQFSVEPSVTINRAALPAGDFTTSLLRMRTDYAFSPLKFLSALVQYSSNDRTFSSNVRFRWEYRPGSEVFVVYTDERDTTTPGYPGLRNRAFVVKVNRLFRF